MNMMNKMNLEITKINMSLWQPILLVEWNFNLIALH